MRPYNKQGMKLRQTAALARCAMRNRLSLFLALTLSVAVVGLSGRARAQGAPAPTAALSPLATSDGETTGMQVQVKQLKIVGGDTLMLQFTLFNNSESSFAMSGVMSTGCCSPEIDAVNLVDLANKKKYEVIRDADKNCLCSRKLSDIPAKGSLNLYANFPAPPESVQKIEVNIPHFIPMDDVPISR
jgi:hypothetical protein